MKNESVKKSTNYNARVSCVIGEVRNWSGRVNDIIDRYGEITERRRREVADMFTDAELMTVAAAINGTKWRPAATIDQGIATRVANSPRPNIEQWGVNQTALARKLTGLTYEQSCALIELVSERVWSSKE